MNKIKSALVSIGCVTFGSLLILVSLNANASISIPGIIEAEDFDGYEDSTWYNSGGKYRWGGVDIGETNDNGGGYYVGWTRKGEYLHYNIDVSNNGLYVLNARVASIHSGRSFHFKLDGQVIGESVIVPNTGDWHIWQTVSTTVNLPYGAHILEVYFDSAELNLNFVEISAQPAPTDPEEPAISPTLLPGKVEAENYLGFYDTTLGNTGGAYRYGDVDIETTTDMGGGYNVGWIASGEYLRYPISVTAAGNYQLNARVATIKSGRSLQFKLNGNSVGEVLSIPNTNGWQNWSDAKTIIHFPAGEHELEVLFQGDEFNFNYLNITRVDDEQPTPTEPGWSMVWQDEFNGNTIDSTKWEHAVDGNGGGNNELQYYTARSENSYVENGHLVIKALRDRYTGTDGTRDYTSARLSTPNKADFLYGKVEVKAKMPAGQGLWPAIWMLPTDWVYGGWASSGEIDIMEAVNLQASGGNNVHGTLHYGGKWPNNVHTGKSYTPDTSVVDNFHVYSIEWEPGEIRWYVDGEHYQTQTDWWSESGEYPAPFNQRFHLILNVAVGGNWPGSPDGNTVFPQTMEVDYVRAYKWDEDAASNKSRLTVINNGGGLVTSEDDQINCGAVCTQNITEPTEIILSAVALSGFEFLGWSTPSLCKEGEANTQSKCTITQLPDQEDTTIQAYFSADESCTQTSPYDGHAVLIPGRIEAENYDEGCAGDAYLDTDKENVGGRYRSGEVDIESATDTNGGHNIGWLRDGEWLNYTVNVPDAGSYDFMMRVASAGNGSSVHFTRDNNNIGGNINIPATNGWQNWKTVTVRGIPLEAGIQTITLHIDDGDFNLNYFDIGSAGAGPFTVNKARGEWTLVVIPDTQHYSQNRDNAPIAHMRTAFDWIVQTKDELNIKFVQGLGDIVESWNNGWEWDNSTSAWDKLYGQVPFMPIIGNHDDPWTMNQYFPSSSFWSESWWGGDFGGVENNFGLMSIGNEDYMFLQVETYDQYTDYRPAGMSWAKDILATYPNRKVILATHDTWATDHIKNNLLYQYDNIILSNAGHVCQREAHYTTNGPRGGLSNNFIVDYQCDAQEVMLIRYYVFKPMEDRVDYYTYSPVTEQFEVDSSSEGSFTLIQTDP